MNEEITPTRIEADPQVVICPSILADAHGTVPVLAYNFGGWWLQRAAPASHTDRQSESTKANGAAAALVNDGLIHGEQM